jgi:Immunity protein family (Imm11)
MAQVPSDYYVLTAYHPKRMLLGSLADPSFNDSWVFGQRFTAAPPNPVRASILAGYEHADVLDYFGTPPIMSERFYQALTGAGVDNLDVYEAQLVSADASVRLQGYKAFNVLGLVRAADLERTKFAPDSRSRLIDASMDSLAIDPAKARGLLLFRLAEYSGAVIVHGSVKRALEKHAFPHVVFQDPAQLVS